MKLNTLRWLVCRVYFKWNVFVCVCSVYWYFEEIRRENGEWKWKWWNKWIRAPITMNDAYWREMLINKWYGIKLWADNFSLCLFLKKQTLESIQWKIKACVLCIKWNAFSFFHSFWDSSSSSSFHSVSTSFWKFISGYQRCPVAPLSLRADFS